MDNGLLCFCRSCSVFEFKFVFSSSLLSLSTLHLFHEFKLTDLVHFLIPQTPLDGGEKHTREHPSRLVGIIIL